MPRLRTDQACLDAQVRSQVAQQLTAELAVACPDCGVEAGRACRDSFDRAVRTHLARSVAANRRDTEPCPPIELLEAPMSPSFRELIERHERAIVETIASMQVPRASLERLPGLASWLPEQTPTAPDCAPAIAPEAVASTVPDRSVRCPTCKAAPGERCNTLFGTHVTRVTVPVCACGQEIRHRTEGMQLAIYDERVCNDCFAANLRTGSREGVPLDKRIAETKSDDATECAWSTPTSDGEGWR